VRKEDKSLRGKEKKGLGGGGRQSRGRAGRRGWGEEQEEYHTGRPPSVRRTAQCLRSQGPVKGRSQEFKIYLTGPEALQTQRLPGVLLGAKYPLKDVGKFRRSILRRVPSKIG